MFKSRAFLEERLFVHGSIVSDSFYWCLWRYRDSYTLSIHAQEVISVAMEARRDLSSMPKPLLIGHSFGGWVSLVCGRSFGDSPIRVRVRVVVRVIR